MIRFRLSSLLCGAILLLYTACSQDEPAPRVVGDGDTEPEQYYFSGLLQADGLELEPSDIPAVQYEFTAGGPTMRGQIFRLYAVGTMYSDRTDEGADYNADFKRLADSIGDGNCYAPGWSSVEQGAYRHTLTSGIRSISLTALSDYSDAYPKGSDLSYITQVYSLQLHKQANRKLAEGELQRIQQKYGKQVRPPFDAFLKQERISMLNEWRDVAIPTGRGYVDSDNEMRGRLLFGFILLTEPPIVAEQTLRLTLTLMDGTVLTRDLILRLGN